MATTHRRSQLFRSTNFCSPRAARTCCAFRRRAAWTTASPRSSAACSTTRSRSTKTRCAPSRAKAPRRPGRSILRCSPTACAPSASRASPSTSPIAIFPRRGASSSSPTRPGHEQYTRNMATGASTADAAVVLIDASKGVLIQSRRHAYIASLLRRAPRAGGREQDGSDRLRRGGIPRH